MFRIAVIDDSKELTEIVRTIIKRQARASGVENEISIRTYTDPEILLEDVRTQKSFHIFVLDVEMPKMTGMMLAENIRAIQEEGYIVFLSSYPEYAVYGYEREAYQYILKEHMDCRLPAVMERLFERCVQEYTEYYCIANQQRMEKIKCRNIIYVKKEGKNCVLYTRDEEHFVRKTLEQVRRELEPIGFIYIDRGGLVNVEHIEKIEKSKVYMVDGAEMEISRSNIKRVKNLVAEYWRERL